MPMTARSWSSWKECHCRRCPPSPMSTIAQRRIRNAYQKQWCADNHDRAREIARKSWATNKLKRAVSDRKRRAGKSTETSRRWRVAHPHYAANRKRRDENYRLAENLRSRLSHALTAKRSGSAIRDL